MSLQGFQGFDRNPLVADPDRWHFMSIFRTKFASGIVPDGEAYDSRIYPPDSLQKQRRHSDFEEFRAI